MHSTRRNFLKSTGALALGAGAGFAFDLSRLNAFAADTGGYKALVCVYLTGGMDCHDTIIPFDVSSYNQHADIRRTLFDLYETNEGGSTRTHDQLQQLNLSNASDFSGRQFAMPPELGPLRELFNQGDCAVVSNVGPLVEPLTRQQFQQGTVPTPPRLFSHNDQNSVWLSSRPEGSLHGWGGRFADIMQAAQANSNTTFTAVSIANSTVFLSGELAAEVQVAPSGPQEIRGVGANSRIYGSTGLSDLFEDQLRVSGEPVANLIQRDVNNVVNQSIDANRFLRDAFNQSTPPVTVFPDTELGDQFSVVARMIALRETLGVRRQVFFIRHGRSGGYDNHNAQHTSIPGLHDELARSMRAFYDATVELGVASNVTSFTASDFGRTLTTSSNGGTQHGWGGHHLVMGGAVNGSRIIGDLPEPALGHNLDTGSAGRLIPTTSVDQYAATLGRWFGLSASELNDALPGLSSFNNTDLGLFL